MRFHFDVTDGDWQSRDDEGIDLADLDEARDHALSLLPDLSHDAVPDDRRTIVIKCRTDQSPVMKLTLSLVVEVLDEVGSAR